MLPKVHGKIAENKALVDISNKQRQQQQSTTQLRTRKKPTTTKKDDQPPAKQQQAEHDLKPVKVERPASPPKTVQVDDLPKHLDLVSPAKPVHQLEKAPTPVKPAVVQQVVPPSPKVVAKQVSPQKVVATPVKEASPKKPVSPAPIKLASPPKSLHGMEDDDDDAALDHVALPDDVQVIEHTLNFSKYLQPVMEMDIDEDGFQNAREPEETPVTPHHSVIRQEDLTSKSSQASDRLKMLREKISYAKKSNDEEAIQRVETPNKHSTAPTETMEDILSLDSDTNLIFKSSADETETFKFVASPSKPSEVVATKYTSPKKISLPSKNRFSLSSDPIVPIAPVTTTTTTNKQPFSFIPSINANKNNAPPSNINTSVTTFLQPEQPVATKKPATEDKKIKSLIQAEKEKKKQEEKEKERQKLKAEMDRKRTEKQQLEERPAKKPRTDSSTTKTNMPPPPVPPPHNSTNKAVPSAAQHALDKKLKLQQNLKLQQKLNDATKLKNPNLAPLANPMYKPPSLASDSKTIQPLRASKSNGSTCSADSHLSTYELSEEYPDSSDEDEHDKRRQAKTVPSWAKQPELDKYLHRTERLDPDKIFDPVQSCNLDEIFSGQGQPEKRMRPRTSSANWSKDHFTDAENVLYRREMGFK